MEFLPLSESEDRIGKIIVHSAYQVHRSVGPGLLEKVYEVCLSHELQKTVWRLNDRWICRYNYEGMLFNEGLRLDLLVNDLVIVELKAVELTDPVYEA